MTAAPPERPAWRMASQRLFAGVLALLFAWHALPTAAPVAASAPAVHVAPATPGVSTLREAAKLGPPSARLTAQRSQAGLDGAPPPALPAIIAQVTPPTRIASAGWSTTGASTSQRRTGDLYSARAPPMTV
ncbi:hypothetical protein ACFSC3_12575 [Sphingomonas floccifaciens]|uniref:Uncharacterized protein n=1 Tax=Sphingomonas floccifaciens TaxID=1844115 RepID=A0ABW4NFA0_9SPHN